jgi:hypothetical protein
VPENPIAAILRPQLGGDKVKEYVELLYSTSRYVASEMLHYMGQPEDIPYKAYYGTLSRRDDGSGQVHVPWEGQVMAGHNPYLFARLVDNLRVGKGTYPDGSSKLEWDERPRPVIDW